MSPTRGTDREPTVVYFDLQQVRILHLDVKVEKSKSHFSKFSNFQTKIFTKLKKFQNFVDVTTSWLFLKITTIALFRIRTTDTLSMYQLPDH